MKIREIKFTKEAESIMRLTNETLQKESKIPSDYIPVDMDDDLQRLLGCGKYEVGKAN